MRVRHAERHLSSRAGWLRAAVLGADDGIVSTSSLMLGVAASSASASAVFIAGLAGLVAGALSMAAGEYVSVSSQRDAERADIDREQRELRLDPHGELAELTEIYQKRGLDAELAARVADQLSAHDRLGAHLRDELVLDHDALAKPWQAAIVSAVGFASAGALPLITELCAPAGWQNEGIAAVSLCALAGLGALGGYLGGAPMARAALRVTVGGGFAMAVTSLIGGVLGK